MHRDGCALLRDVLDRLKLKSFVKVSGSKGLQLHVPLNTPVTYAETQPFARTIAEFMAKQKPKLIVALRDDKDARDVTREAASG